MYNVFTFLSLQKHPSKVSKMQVSLNGSTNSTTHLQQLTSMACIQDGGRVKLTTMGCQVTLLSNTGQGQRIMKPSASCKMDLNSLIYPSFCQPGIFCILAKILLSLTSAWSDTLLQISSKHQTVTGLAKNRTLRSQLFYIPVCLNNR